MKKLLMALLLVSGLAHAETFNFVYYYPPGGGTDTWASPVVEELQKRGHTVNREYFKSCHDAANYALSKKNSFIVGGPYEFIPNDNKRCPALNEQPNIKYFTNISSSSAYLCTSPRNADLTLNDLTNGKQVLKVGHPANLVFTPAYKMLANTSVPKLNVKFIPYVDVGAMRGNVIAGTDLDMIFLGNTIELVEKAGGKCLASSTRKNHKNLPFIGDVVKSDMPEMPADLDLWSVGTVDPATTKLFTEVFKSQTFRDFITARPTHTHRGLGAGVTTEQGFKNYSNTLNAIGSLY